MVVPVLFLFLSARYLPTEYSLLHPEYLRHLIPLLPVPVPSFPVLLCRLHIRSSFGPRNIVLVVSVFQFALQPHSMIKALPHPV